MRILTGGNVGIGTSSPSNKLDVKGTVGFEATNSTNKWLAYTYTDNSLRLNYNGAGADEVVINSSGNVGIGTSSPGSYNSSLNTLVVAGSADSGITIASGTANEGSIAFADGTSGAEAYRGWINYNHNSNFMRFFTNSTERLRIDSSGNLFVATTSDVVGDTSGTGLSYASGYLAVSRDTSSADAAVQYLNRTGADGQYLQFRKDGSSVGSIGSTSGSMFIQGSVATGKAGLTFYGASIEPRDTGAAADDAVDLGATGARFRDIYAGNATIQTSDRNEKQDIEELSEAEQRVAVACKGLLRKFRWKSAVEKKGDDARIHFGIIAQDLQDAFTAEGLDAGRYGMFINSTWTDEETGEERSRMGVRYSELLAFIISAI
jgi:hypothetical protein